MAEYTTEQKNHIVNLNSRGFSVQEAKDIVDGKRLAIKTPVAEVKAEEVKVEKKEEPKKDAPKKKTKSSKED